jgi:hypothetical protein
VEFQKAKTQQARSIEIRALLSTSPNLAARDSGKSHRKERRK